MLYQLSYLGPMSATFCRTGTLERVMGIEPTSSAWKAEVLPLNYTRSLMAPICRPLPESPPPPPQVVEGEGFEPSKA